MEYLKNESVKLSNGETINYKVTASGIYYHESTPDEVVDVLENARINRIRLLLDYGDVETGVSWGEDCEITGYIGHSTGTVKIPLLIFNSSSSGGGGILDHRIIAIHTSKGKIQLYKLKK